MAASVVFGKNILSGLGNIKPLFLACRLRKKPVTVQGGRLPYNRVFEESKFFVYSLGDETMCISDDCGIGGYFVGCLGGWISGYKDIGEVSDYGLRSAGVDIDKQKLLRLLTKTLGL